MHACRSTLEDPTDTLVGGPGSDTLRGGDGADRFLFDTAPRASGHTDLMADFTAGQDVIVLDRSVFGSFDAGVAVAGAQFAAGPGVDQATTAAQRLLYDTTSGTLYYDRDGTGAAAALPVAVLGASTHPTLGSGDFLVVA